MNEHYVYMVIDTKTLDVKYIGKGKGDRYKHILSGASGNYDANKAYHLGLTKDCQTYKLIEDVSDEYAQKVEKSLIYGLQPKWNNDHVHHMPDISDMFMDGAFRVKTLIEHLIRYESKSVSGSKIDTLIRLIPFVYLPTFGDGINKGVLLNLSKEDESFLNIIIEVRGYLGAKFNEYMNNDEDWELVDWKS